MTPNPKGKSILSKRYRIFFVDGPGQIVDSYRSWSAGEDFISETQLTFSGQMFDFCRAHGLPLYAVSWNPDRALVRDGAFVVENRPKPLHNPHGVFYHLNQVWYGLSLTVLALRSGADVAVVTWTTHWFVFSLLTLARVRVIPCLHCSFWPNGYPQGAGRPKKLSARSTRGFGGTVPRPRSAFRPSARGRSRRSQAGATDRSSSSARSTIPTTSSLSRPPAARQAPVSRDLRGPRAARERRLRRG